MIKVGVWMAGVVCLTSCATQYSSSDKQQYLESKNGPELVTPPPLSASNLSNFYNLPSPEKGSTVSVLPPQV